MGKKNIRTYRIIQIQRNGIDIMAIAYPKDEIIPIVGDNLTILDHHKKEYMGKVISRTITIREYREIRLVVNCT